MPDKLGDMLADSPGFLIARCTEARIELEDSLAR